MRAVSVACRVATASMAVGVEACWPPCSLARERASVRPGQQAVAVCEWRAANSQPDVPRYLGAVESVYAVCVPARVCRWSEDRVQRESRRRSQVARYRRQCGDRGAGASVTARSASGGPSAHVYARPAAFTIGVDAYDPGTRQWYQFDLAPHCDRSAAPVRWSLNA